jgi:hypothetical protein
VDEDLERDRKIPECYATDAIVRTTPRFSCCAINAGSYTDTFHTRVTKTPTARSSARRHACWTVYWSLFTGKPDTILAWASPSYRPALDVP